MRRSQIESMKPRVRAYSPYSSIEIGAAAERASMRNAFKPAFLRQRIYVIFIALIVVSVLLFVYQAFTVGRLAHILYTDDERRQQSGFVLNKGYQKADDLMEPMQPPEPQRRTIEIKGVLHRDLKHYIPNARGNFKCVHTGVEISYDKVNDDYCDCDDGTDEPSTNACPHGRFFCTTQRTTKPYWIPTGWINDGYCDCCDGSDEWTKAARGVNIHLPEAQQKRMEVFVAPCSDRC